MDAVLIEIRAGTGGDEAALFALDLYRMYSKYLALKNWKFQVLDINESDLDGLKQIVFEIRGENVLAKMQYEAGVHRVQRVPKTEKSNRLHTSTVSVAVLPKPAQASVKINPADITMDFFKASGPGGQYVNKRQTAVRIIHKPTGLTVASQTSRSLEDNKKAALSILEAKLYAQEREKIDSALTEQRRTQIGKAQRAEKIRTYNFPQDRITDHRLNKSWHNIEKILDGNLDPVVDKLQEQIK